MYQPAHHREDRLEVQHGLIRSQPLGLLVTAGTSGLQANLLPFELNDATGELGVLEVHMAKANPQWRDIETHPDVLVVFQGPHAYVSPSWYPSKQETGKVVPTWNYIIVQAYGTARIINDRDWLHRQVEALTDRREAQREEPWAVDDAPERFIDAMIKGIVGVAIDVTRIEGKWKISQNRTQADQNGVFHGLTEDTGPAEARRLANSMQTPPKGPPARAS